MKTASVFVRAFWDDDAKVWVATSNDIEGLSVEGATREELTDKVVTAVADQLFGAVPALQGSGCHLLRTLVEGGARSTGAQAGL